MFSILSIYLKIKKLSREFSSILHEVANHINKIVIFRYLNTINVGVKLVLTRLLDPPYTPVNPLPPFRKIAYK